MEIGYLSEVKAILKSLIISSPTQITIAQLNRDYKDFEGEFIPFRRLGFNSLDSFLRSIPDTLAVTGCGDAACVTSVAIEKSKHISDMIKQQKRPPTNGKTRSRPKSILGRSSKNEMVKSTSRNSGRNHNKNRSKGHQFSPFQITNRNVSTRTVRVRDVPADRSQILCQTPLNTDRAVVSYTAPQSSGKEIQSSSHNGHQNKQVALITTETPQIVHNPKQYEEIKLLAELLNTTCHVKASASKVLLNTHESANKATVTRRTKQLLNGLNGNINGALNETEERQIYKKGSSMVDNQLLDNSDAKANDLNAAVPEFALNSPIYRLNFPKYSVPFGHEIPSYKLPDNVDVNTCIGVFIAEIYSPFKFWFHIEKEEHELDMLMNEIEKFYTSLKPHELRLSEMLLVRGHVCAVIFNDVWYRAEIVAPPVGDKIKVALVDYGTVTEVNIMEIKYLVSYFADVPAQAIRGCLSHIKPRGSSRWSHEATMHFLSSVMVKILFAKISAIDKENMVFYMVLCDTNGDDVIQINKDLIAKGYALYDDKDWQESKIIEKNECPPLLSCS